MPPRRGPKPITQIKRAGEMDVDYTVFEGTRIETDIEECKKEIIEAVNSAKAATIRRRIEVSKEFKRKGDFDDIISFLQGKTGKKYNRIHKCTQKLAQLKETKSALEIDHKTVLAQKKQSIELERVQLVNNRDMLRERLSTQASVAARENQLKREIAEAQQTFSVEKQQQSIQMSTALDDYYKLHRNHERELVDSVEREKQKNRGMTSENLEKTVIEMMREIESEKSELSNSVKKARAIAMKNTELMEKNKSLYMNRDLIQSECDTLMKAISSNDVTIKSLVEELKLHDQKITMELENAMTEVHSNSPPSEPSPEPSPPQSPQERSVDRESMLNQFFEESVQVLCDSVVRILILLDSSHSSDYSQFHQVFNSFEGRKKELRFLMSKLGNITFINESGKLLPPISINDIEGADEVFTRKNLIDPQHKAIIEFAEPIRQNEFPSLLATHFFS